MIDQFLQSAVQFGISTIGIITKPYQTYRTIVDRSNPWELAVISIVLWLYFLTASLVKTSLFRPYLLTRQLVLLVSAAGVTFIVAVLLFWLAGRIVGSRGTLRGLAIGWGYSLMPTVIWFFMTSVLYLILPPPRTTSAQGVVFSMLYLLISTTLLAWKVTLSYLALRFGLRLDLLKIIIVCLMVFPILGMYSVGMYKLGIFRIPFI